ncbi:MAG: PQQ-binding-like beta-propeller repeat protein [DPANN group archaeon]|nr:PQQ-binding-like beta-propeller repeat protein [DPANN group archaeon]
MAKISNRNILLATAGIIMLAFVLAYSGYLENFAGVSPIPSEVTAYSHEWPLPNHDYANTRATTDSAINSQNVGSLKVAWAYNLKGSGAFGILPTIPLIIGSNVYFQDIYANVYALDMYTGAPKWIKIYNASGMIGPNGVAAGYGKIYAQKDLHNMVALDINTGAEIWSTKLSNISTTGIDIQPQVYDNMIYTSTVPGTGDAFYSAGGMGVLYALDANNGKIKWSFNTVKDGDLWGHPEVNSGGGAWYTPPIDLKTGIMYWGIGNPAPFPGTAAWPNGASHPGPNLYCDSSLAIEHKTGELKWYYQALQHDIQDHDLQIGEILVNNVSISGKTHDIVLATGKMGKVYAIDRTLGNLLWSVPVGKHTPNDQWDQFPSKDMVDVSPSVIGGVETPMAYSDGIVYIAVEDLVSSWNSTSTDFTKIDFAKGGGELVALDVRSGNTIWAADTDGVNVGGATVANDVVFTANFNGKILAYNKKTGEKLFEYQAPGGINGQPAVAGNMIIFPIGMGKMPQILAFKLPE